MGVPHPPPVGRCLSGRFHNRKKLRGKYEADMGVRHEAFVRPRGFEPDDEVRAHAGRIRGGNPTTLRDREPVAGGFPNV